MCNVIIHDILIDSVWDGLQAGVHVPMETGMCVCVSVFPRFPRTGSLGNINPLLSEGSEDDSGGRVTLTLTLGGTN